MSTRRHQPDAALYGWLTGPDPVRRWAWVGCQNPPLWVREMLDQTARDALAGLAWIMMDPSPMRAPSITEAVRKAAQRVNRRTGGEKNPLTHWRMPEETPGPRDPHALDVPALWGVDLAYYWLFARSRELAEGMPERFKGEARAVRHARDRASSLSDLLAASTGFMSGSDQTPTGRQIDAAWSTFEGAAGRVGMTPVVAAGDLYRLGRRWPHAA